MPNTDFSRWQDRLGLTRVAAAAEALGISRQSVNDLRRGKTQPHPSTRRLMEILEEHPEIISQIPRFQ
jgi:DNA-binding transcriptional regulator YiaG